MTGSTESSAPIAMPHPAAIVAKCAQSVILAGGQSTELKIGSFEATIGFDHHVSEEWVVIIRGKVSTHEQVYQAVEAIRAENLSSAWSFSVIVSDQLFFAKADDRQSGSVVA